MRRWLWLALVLSCGRCEHAVRRALAAGGTFTLESTVLLSAERRGADVGYRLVSELGVAPAPADDSGDDLHLQFTLSAPRLQVRGAARAAEWSERASAWDAGGGGAWSLRAGAVRLSPADAPDVRAYKRALAALFHYRPGARPAAERAEEDALGACDVVYEEHDARQHRRVKLRCAADAAAGAAARRAARYSLDGAGALAALHAEEALDLPAGLRARSWHVLARRGPAPVPVPGDAGDEGDAAGDAAGDEGDEADEDERAELSAAIRENRAALEGEAPGEGGGAEAAHALLRLLPALRAASPDALGRALRDAANRDRLPGLCRALGLAGTAASVRAARDFLQPAASDPLEPLALAFLAGFALAPHAPDEAALDVLKLAAEARRDSIAAAALLGAAGAARGRPARAAVREALTRALARCRDAECRAVRLLALGNLRADAAESLLEHAEREEPRVAAAALAALRFVPGLRPAHVARLDRLATNASSALEVRAAALELALARRAGAEGLARALHAERSPAAAELRRVLWQRLDRAPRTWEERAADGASGALTRDTGWAAGGWRARLDSVQLAARGVLRRGTVALLAVAPDNTTHPELEVSVWTRGLEALAGVEGAEGAEEEAAAGGLALAVGGRHLHDITLFDGQAELLGHVWAGRGAAPAAVLRALRPLPPTSAALPLLGGAVLRVRARAAVALALDARAAASLWHRTARGALALRAALHADARARLRTSWAELSAERTVRLEPRLRVSLALDLHAGAAVCVRAAAPDHAAEETTVLRSAAGARRLRVLRRRTVRAPAPGRTLALGRANDAACRTLRAADDDDDDE